MKLGEQLDQIRARAEKSFPAPALELIHRATAELQTSGILERMIKVGDRLPGFELPNHKSDVIKSADLLAKGPLILTVYRGLW